jgi:4-amino-4-deoxy-L-arabinose transferase-like glycosyltransferase
MNNSKRNSLKTYLPLILLIGILAIGAFFRFYRIREYLTFLGDEGRDMLVVKRIIVDHKLTLLGPVTSVGSMYMGPIYYYLMVPFLWVWHLDPVGPSVMVALFSLATIFLLFRTGKEFFDTKVGLIASFLYAISPLTVLYGRSSWNPNIVPFFSLLTMYSVFRAVAKKRFRWLIVAGLSMGVLIQLHYVTLMFFPIILAVLFLIRLRIPLKIYILSVLGFLIMYSPFLLFEVRHGFVNFHSVLRFVSQQNTHTSALYAEIINTIMDVSIRVFWRLVIIQSAELTKLCMIFGVIILYLFYRSIKSGKDTVKQVALKALLLWLVIGILSYGIYHGVVYDYYLGSLFTAVFLISGIVIWQLSQKVKFGNIITIIIMLILTGFNLSKSPILIEPNNLMLNTETIARSVLKESGGKPYNFALIAGQNSDHAYRYFLEIWGHPPVTIENPAADPQRNTVTDQLIVVCEEKVCQPEGHPLWEIAGFGRAQITDEQSVVTAKVFRLVHYKISKL